MSANLEVAIAGAVPALIAMVLVDRIDRKRPEPLSTRWLVALVGMASVIPVLIIGTLLGSQVEHALDPQFTYQGATWLSFVTAAGLEEACKIAVVYWIVWRRPEFDERLDGIVYACRAGLGFALVENVLYLFNQTTLTGAISVWIARALLAVPGHAMWTGMIGAMAARRRFDGKGLGLVGGYLLAVAFHGAYDLTVFIRQPLHLEGHDQLAALLLVGPFALTIAAFLVIRSMARTALQLDDAEAAQAALQAAVQPRSSYS